MHNTDFLDAVERHRQGNLNDAEVLYERWLAIAPDDVEALQLLGLVLAQTNRLDRAIDRWLRALTLAPHRADIRNNLGEAYCRMGRHTEAATQLEHALAQSPEMTECRFNLANAWKELDRLEDAVQGYRLVLMQRPDHAKAWFNLGNALREQGKLLSAKDAYTHALALRGDWPKVLQNLGITQLDLDEVEEALQRFEAAAQLQPQATEWDDLRGIACQRLGRTAEARNWFARAAKQSPEDPLKQLRAQLLVTPIAGGVPDAESDLANITNAITKYAQCRAPLDIRELHSSGIEPPMSLAYQHVQLKQLFSHYADVFGEQICFEPPTPRIGKPHLGIVVTRGHEGVFAACFGGIASQLSSADLDVSIVCPQSTANTLRHLCGPDAFQYLLVPARLDQASDTIRSANIDALYYWELGTDSTNYFLPFFRAARRQIAGWGWPISSGISHVDDFLSSAKLECDEASAHYRERVHLLPSLPTSYGWKTEACSGENRESFGLSPDDHVYLCHQNLRKWHPQSDQYLERIFAADSKGKLVLIGDKQPTITSLLLDRLQKTAPAAAAKAVVIGFMNKPRYLSLVKLADVVLDTRPYGGGANTVYDAALMHTPMVTWPHTEHRGRWAAAVLTELGLHELISKSGDEFVSIATHLASDRVYRAQIGDLLRERIPSLLQSRSTILEHRDFFLKAIAQR